MYLNRLHFFIWTWQWLSASMWFFTRGYTWYVTMERRELGRSPARKKNDWASLVAQMIKCLPTMRETGVQFLGREDPLEKEMATHSSIPAWKNPMDREAWWATVQGGVQQGKRMITPLQIESSNGNINIFSRKCLKFLHTLTMVWQVWQSLL